MNEITQEEILRLEKVGLAMTECLRKTYHDMKDHENEKEQQLSEATNLCQKLLGTLQQGGVTNGR